MGTLTTKELVRQFVMGKIAGKNERMSIDDKDDIITAGIIDSLGIMQLVAFIEETFSIEIKDEDIVPDNFESIETISSYIEKTK